MRIATRGSELALWQANWVREAIRRRQDLAVELLIVKTQGDRVTDRTLSTLEGKGFFTKEIEDALLARRAEVAVHSYKDLPTEKVPGLMVAAVPPRAPVNDLLLIRGDRTDPSQQPWPIAAGARVGTGAARRTAQLRHRRGDLEVVPIRGNVHTRVGKVRDGTCDAVVLAKAGLERLGLDLSDLVVVDLLESGFLPAPAQGALAVQCREDDPETIAVLRTLHDPDTAACVAAERALLTLFEGGCTLPLGCTARMSGGKIELRANWLQTEGDMRFCTVTSDDAESAARFAYDRLHQP
ncbi:MAG: hydroxymethylbilane synthase [Planctomycetota bacterium]